MLGAELALGGRRRSRRPVDVGRTVRRVEAVGKHLLIGTERRWIRTHVGLRGKWALWPPTVVPGREVAVRLLSEGVQAVALRATEVELVRYVDDPRRLPRLARLGPDLLGEVDLDAVVARARVVRDTERTLAAALTDQGIACGLGNVYKSETCFLAGRHPLTPLEALADDELRAAFAIGQRLLQANRHRRPRVTREQLGPDLWVYDRLGQPCLRCASPIRVTRHTDVGRPVWWCPCCQSG